MTTYGKMLQYVEQMLKTNEKHINIGWTIDWNQWQKPEIGWTIAW
jgi:hypothetical protein